MIKPAARPVCAFGACWQGVNGCGPCRGCQREADRLERDFWLGVFLGKHNAWGYTPREWATHLKRQTATEAT